MEELPWKFTNSYPCYGHVYPCGNYLEVSISSKREGDVCYLVIGFFELFIVSTWSLNCSVMFVLSIASMNFVLVKTFFCRYLHNQSISHAYFGCSTYFFLYGIEYMKGILSAQSGKVGLSWTTIVVLLDGIFALTLKHMQRCRICSSGKTCYLSLQERSIHTDKFSFSMYLCYLVYAPLYIAGPIVSFNAFASQLDMPQRNHSIGQIAWYGFRWVLSLFLMEVMTHFFCYNAFTISGLWREFSPFEVFIIGYGVLNFMWLKFFLIWRYFRFWSLVGGVDVPENMPRCINNCYDLESFWKNWHASFNKWLVRYLYIPLGGSRKKLLNVWVIFTFVAVWHDLEWRLLSWAWLTCLFFIPEMIVKSAVSALKAKSAIHEFILRELGAVAGAITITSLMVANLVGYVIGPSGINWLISRLLHRDGLPVLGGIFTTFYVGTKLMFHIQDTKKNLQ
ncbi:membrane-bound O-acyltransferase gup1 isoform X8 [Magnolia sinica]|uniref:membrane-bound O-acyltransferase gup1 isoform X8 n=1 Tax=Magnolia sinica TaxID=86752 RepID=UPI00265AD287|nr:membrane-bound O-acyltransferase gup1 isoform X8 [Magnolia sinica]